MKSNKLGGGTNSSKLNMYENDIMTIENYVALFRCYTDMTIYILGDKDDNELVLAMVLDTVHECFDKVFKHAIERKSLISNMTAVILVIDELVDQGIIMATDTQTILKRINIRGSLSSSQQEDSTSSVLAGAGITVSGSASASVGGGMFASVFASAKSQLAKTLAL